MVVVILKNVLDYYYKILISIAYVLLFLCILMVVTDVFLRWGSGKGLPATMEIIRLLLPFLTFIPLAHTLNLGKHINVDTLIDKMPKTIRNILYTSTDLIGLAFTVFVAYCMWKYFVPSFEIKESASGAYVYIPLYLGKFAAFLGVVSMIPIWISQIVINLRGVASK